jgi:hypothetical protein
MTVAVPRLTVERRLLREHALVIACDEVGRGALAGPVAVGAAATAARRRSSSRGGGGGGNPREHLVVPVDRAEPVQRPGDEEGPADDVVDRDETVRGLVDVVPRVAPSTARPSTRRRTSISHPGRVRRRWCRST